MIKSTVKALSRGRAAGIVFLFLSFSAASAPINLQLNGVAIPELSEAVFKGIMGADYVLAPAVLSKSDKLSISVKDKTPQQVLDIYANVLKSSGVQFQKVDGVYYLSLADSKPAQPSAILPASSMQPLPVAPVAPIVQTLRPDLIRSYKVKNRPVAFLSSLVRFTGATLVEHPDSEYLVYSAPDDLLQKIDTLLNQIDTPPQGLTIRAAVIEYNETNNESRSLSAALDLLSGKLNLAFRAGSALANSITYRGASLQAALSILDGDARFNYLAQPVLRVLNNEHARLVVGSDVPVRGASTLDKNGNPVASVEYQTSGLVIDLKPRITGDQIILEVDQQISTFAQTTTSNIDSPTRNKRQAQTVLDIRRGDLIVMAGLEEQKTSNSSSGLSWLPRFLRSSLSADTKSQILLLIEVLPA